MRILAGLAVVTALGAGLIATGALAQPGRLTDVGYMQVARCAGLASSANLGSSEGATLKSLLRNQSIGRQPYVLDQADEAQQKAKREADHADDYSKSKLQAELNGACASLKS